jgi:hypothetical protein
VLQDPRAQWGHRARKGPRGQKEIQELLALKVHRGPQVNKACRAFKGIKAIRETQDPRDHVDPMGLR